MRGLFGRLQVRHVYPLFPIAMYAAIVARPLNDNSFLWHVRAGSLQASAGRVLTTDPFSFMVHGNVWRTQSWLADLGYSVLESLIGDVRWAPAMVAVTGVVVLTLAGLAVYGSVGSVVGVTLWLLVATWLMAPFGVPRPVIFSYLLLSALVLALKIGRPALWIVVPLIWVWAGIHGSWIIGMGLVILESIRKADRKVAVVAGLSAVFTLATAHGFGVWGVVQSFARSTGALESMQEWLPPDFGDIVQGPYLLLVGAVLLAAARGKIAPRDLIVVFPFLVFGLTSRRAVPVATLVVLAYAAQAVRISDPRASAHRSAVSWFVAILIGVVVVVVHALPHQTLDGKRFPSGDAIAAAGTGRVFHDQAVGGYLIYLEGPARRVYIDDRAELYGAERYSEYRAATDGDYEGLFDRWSIRAAIVNDGWPLLRVLEMDGWTRAFSEEGFVVLRAPAK